MHAGYGAAACGKVWYMCRVHVCNNFTAFLDFANAKQEKQSTQSVQKKPPQTESDSHVGGKFTLPISELAIVELGGGLLLGQPLDIHTAAVTQHCSHDTALKYRTTVVLGAFGGKT